MLTRTRLSLAVMAAMAALAAPQVGQLMVPSFFAPPPGKGNRKHRMSGRPGGRRGNSSSHIAHQGPQERLRRLCGGWAYQRRHYGLTKQRAIAQVALRAEGWVV